METYIAVFIIEMLLGFLVLGKHPQIANNTRKIVYLLLTSLILGTTGGLRSSLVGFDTENYYIAFLRTSDSLQRIFDNPQHIETGFAALCTIIKVLGGNFVHLLLICSFFIVGCFSIFVYRHSSNVLLSIFILLCFPYYYSSFDIMRHFVATSFLLLAYKYILNGKFIKYSIFIIAGAIFHKTALIYIILYPLLRTKWSTKLMWSVFAIGVIIMIYATAISLYIVEETGTYGTIAEVWVGKNAGGSLTALMYFVIFIMAYLLRKNLVVPSRADIYLICVLLLFVFAFIFMRTRIVVRYIMTFAGLLAVAMPNLLYTGKSKDNGQKEILFFLFIIIGLSYHAFMLITNWQNVVPYIPSFVYPYD